MRSVDGPHYSGCECGLQCGTWLQLSFDDFVCHPAGRLPGWANGDGGAFFVIPDFRAGMTLLTISCLAGTKRKTKVCSSALQIENLFMVTHAARCDHATLPRE